MTRSPEISGAQKDKASQCQEDEGPHGIELVGRLSMRLGNLLGRKRLQAGYATGLQERRTYTIHPTGPTTKRSARPTRNGHVA
jgi:hypothetical protein